MKQSILAVILGISLGAGFLSTAQAAAGQGKVLEVSHRGYDLRPHRSAVIVPVPVPVPPFMMFGFDDDDHGRYRHHEWRRYHHHREHDWRRHHGWRGGYHGWHGGYHGRPHHEDGWGHRR